MEISLIGRRSIAVTTGITASHPLMLRFLRIWLAALSDVGDQRVVQLLGMSELVTASPKACSSASEWPYNNNTNKRQLFKHLVM